MFVPLGEFFEGIYFLMQLDAIGRHVSSTKATHKIVHKLNRFSCIFYRKYDACKFKKA
jgi:hypothetical protein